MARLSIDREQYMKFSRPRNTCLLCMKPLNVDGRHQSQIALGDADEAVRKDFCLECWGSMGREEYFSFWVTTRVSAPSAEERRLAKSDRNEALWRLFAALYAAESRDLAPQLFLLAHLLMKYKVLIFVGVQPDGRLGFKAPKLDDLYFVEDVAIDSVDFSTVKASVEEQALAYVPKDGEEE